ncbi:MAG TPA: PhaM family polyhydroxyalkanoate granule multifunctional regulatory protein, partial [Aquabacterium sp.]|nr:PhaM family polyhydroxyalkanoate granule multifunctional regulatory protein [Aquabacterium sp.]
DPSGAKPSGAASPFSGLGAGLEFFQDWMKAASSALPNLGAASAPTGSAWAMPTLDPEELDKRIQELKTVQFWLEQNARMIGMTIQTLEVQRMTLNTLRGMKVPVDALRDALKAQPEQAAPAADAPPPTDTDSQTDASAQAGVNPMAWWGTLTEQFTTLASQAVQAGQDAMSGLQPAPADTPAATPTGAAAKKAPRTTGARKPSTGGSDDAPAKPARKATRR